MAKWGRMALTAYAERNHLTMRRSNGRRVRKTLSLSNEAEMDWASAGREDLVYNLARPQRPCAWR